MKSPFDYELSRRHALQAGALFGGSAVLLAACGGGGGSSSSGTSVPANASISKDGAPGDKVPAGVKLAKTQTLTMAISNLPITVDPHVTAGGNCRRLDIYEALVDPHPVTGDIRPFLATSWKLVDPTTLQFTLRDGVKFHNGDALTPDDVVFSMQRAMTDGYGIKSQFLTLAGASVIDTKTVQIKLTIPDVLALKKIAYIGILPKNYYMGLGATAKDRDAAFLKAPIGSGPYKCISYAPEKAVVAKASTTWRTPTLDQITVLQVADAGTQLNSFLAGDVQYVNIQPLTSLDALTGAGASLISLTTGNDLGAFMDSVLNTGAPKPGAMGNQQVRQALNYALNKEELVKSVLKSKTVDDDGQLIGKGLPGYTTAVKAFAYDPQKSNEMMDAAGFKAGADGKRFSITMASAFAGPGSVRRLIGEYMQNSLVKVGVDVQFTALTDTTLASQYFAGTAKQRPDIYHFGLFTRPYMDAAKAYAYFTTASKAYHMNVPAFDTLNDQQLSETDTTKRQDLLAQMTKILHDQSTYLFACGDVWIDAASKKLKGLTQCNVQTEQYLDKLYFVE
jgi:peptide/nickel transport system substrate-binding protein